MSSNLYNEWKLELRQCAFLHLDKRISTFKYISMKIELYLLWYDTFICPYNFYLNMPNEITVLQQELISKRKRCYQTILETTIRWKRVIRWSIIMIYIANTLGINLCKNLHDIILHKKSFFMQRISTYIFTIYSSNNLVIL